MSTKSKTKKSSKSARKKSAAKKWTYRGAMSIATNEKKSVKERVQAMMAAPLAVVENDNDLQSMLKVLRNKDEPIKVRLGALQALQAAAFSVVSFAPARSDYIATLRAVAEDTDIELRQSVLGILVRENDGYAQKKILEGLEKPEKALLPPEKALQLLSYDVHAEAYSIARKIVENPPNPDAKREALRLLAADATAAPLYEKILRDKDEMAENRQIAASALHALKPEKFQEYARDIVLDKSEYDEIQATSLTALSQFGDDEEIKKDKALLRSVDRMSDEASTTVKQHARRFLHKYGK
jgi:hypothetical protein